MSTHEEDRAVPATPPSSRHKRLSVGGEQVPLVKKWCLDPRTPEKVQHSSAPMTPLTSSAFKRAANSTQSRTLARPAENGQRLMQSPEVSPYAQRSFNCASDQKASTNTRRRLFNTQDIKHLSPDALPAMGSRPFDVIPTLSPPKVARRTPKSFVEISAEPADESHSDRRNSLSCPGTPSDRLINDNLIEQWQATARWDTSDDEFPREISSVELKNPFVSSTPITESQRQKNKAQLLREDADLETTITYLDKNGKPVMRKTLNEQDRERYKPRFLFEEELARRDTSEDNG